MDASRAGALALLRRGFSMGQTATSALCQQIRPLSCAVQLHERDGIAWLTFPEAKLYDVLKQTSWLFVPQPSFLAGEEFDRRVDFLIFWQNRALCPVIVEIDSDGFHPPSQRTHDEAREREFQSRRFHFIRFSAKEVIASPTDVLRKIAEFCTRLFGAI